MKGNGLIDSLVDQANIYYNLKKQFKKDSLYNNTNEVSSLINKIFILEKVFLKNWKLYVNYKEIKQKVEGSRYKILKQLSTSNCHHPGKINNNKLIMDLSNYYNNSFESKNNVLKPDSREDFIIINKEIWDFFLIHYGGGPEIKRNSYTYKTSFNKKQFIDLFHIKKEYTDEMIDNLNFKSILISLNEKIEQFKEKLFLYALNKNVRRDSIRLFNFNSNLDQLKSFFRENMKNSLNLKKFSLKSDNFYSLENKPNMIIKDLNGSLVIIDSYDLLDNPEEETKKNECSWCQEKHELYFNCLCKEVWYCSFSCQELDKLFHIEKCRKNSEKSSIYMSSYSKKGLVGLKNLGNTCYMNTALQCISNCFELSNYFLNNHYKNHVNTSTNLGTSGVITKSYAELINNLWYGKESIFSPSSIKTILDKLKSYFTGYKQHDSHEFLIYFLDLLHEDLNQVTNKPHLNTKISDDVDFIRAKESWDLFLRRNQSIIIDLFFGQFKSSLYCLKCENLCSTFDSFSHISLSLISKTFSFEITAYFIFYDCTIYPIRFNLIFKNNCTIMALRNKIAKMMKINPYSFIIFKLNDNGDISNLINSSTLLTMEEASHPFYLMQIDPDLFYSENSSLNNFKDVPDFKNMYQNLKANASKIEKIFNESQEENETGQSQEILCFYSYRYDFVLKKNLVTKYNVDNNYGFGSNYLNTFFYMKTYSKEMKCLIDREKIIFPRMVLIDISKSSKYLHLKIFKLIKPILINFEKTNNPNEIFNELLIHDNSDDELFEYFFKDFETDNDLDSIEYHKLRKYPYRIRIMSIDEKDRCYFCGRRFCEDCLLPFNDNLTVESILSRITKNEEKLLDNTFYFINENQRIHMKNMDFSLELTFLPNYVQAVKTLNQFNELVLNFVKKEISFDEGTALSRNITIYDCLNNFVKYEILNDINEWQCQICMKKQNSLKKKIEIYRAPHILIIHLKRFNVNVKIDNFVEFPLEGLNLQTYVINKDAKESYIYDLFAVSNHNGGIGGGHYIAMAKNFQDKCWYKYDDSNVCKITEKEIISNDAYVLFYRKRNSNLNSEELYLQSIINYGTYDTMSNNPNEILIKNYDSFI